MNTNTIPDLFNTLERYNDMLNGLPSGALVFVFAILLGYMMKLLPFVSNRYIPMGVVTFAVVAFVALNPRDKAMAIGVWLARTLIAGFIIGAVAWMAHSLLLKQLEKRLGLFCGSQDTEIITKETKTDEKTPNNTGS